MESAMKRPNMLSATFVKTVKPPASTATAAAGSD